LKLEIRWKVVDANEEDEEDEEDLKNDSNKETKIDVESEFVVSEMEIFELKDKNMFILSFSRIHGDGFDFLKFINKVVCKALPLK
jgi:hypothetical protein